jgi:hypothetical protein
LDDPEQDRECDLLGYEFTNCQRRLKFAHWWRVKDAHPGEVTSLRTSVAPFGFGRVF